MSGFTKSRLSHVELDALGEWQVVAPIHGARLPAHVLLPRIGTGLAASARFLFAAAGTADLCSRWGTVHISDAASCTHCREEQFRLLEVLGEDRARQTLRHIIVH